MTRNEAIKRLATAAEDDPDLVDEADELFRAIYGRAPEADDWDLVSLCYADPDVSAAVIEYDREQTHRAVLALRDQVDPRGTLDGGTGDLYQVCKQAIEDGEGTPERVREIWEEATSEWAKEQKYQESLR